MSPTVRLARFAVAVAAASALALAGCAATMRVNSYTERGAELGRYRTFGFAAPERVSTGDPRLDSNPFFNERIQADIEKQMAAKGFAKAASAGADLLVHYHASFAQQVDVNNLDRNYGYCRRGDCRPVVYDAGTLLVDLVDAKTNNVVWRGWAEGSVDGVIDNQTWLEQRVDTSVARIFERLPRKL